MLISNGDMEKRPVRLLSKEYKKVKKLYESAFPAYERLPYLPLVLLATRKNTHFDAYYDGDTFCGFTYSVMSKEAVYILFLAVNDVHRGKGYGSAILEDFKERAGQRALVLTIEPLESDAKNYDERLKRLAFYERNGFKATPYTYHEGKEYYTVLATHDHLDEKELESLFKRAICCMVPVKLTK
ncbi:GNAT family N-acetyltransferase [Streptococcus hyointestinalis]|uniref:GNAT family N-acetyltransferase n=2 Tax=Streptococcus hyointestinalis TaxID=1337 RepID=UPI0023F82DF9|nr:GNAT family N-acetyltransferase [Streptococcus hyointestinalis]